MLLEDSNIFLRKSFYQQLKEQFKTYITYSTNLVRQEIYQYQTLVMSNNQNIITRIQDINEVQREEQYKNQTKKIPTNKTEIEM